MITTPIFRCGRCHGNRTQAGRRKRLICGVHIWVCAHCVANEHRGREEGLPVRTTAGGSETRGVRADAPRLKGAA